MARDDFINADGVELLDHNPAWRHRNSGYLAYINNNMIYRIDGVGDGYWVGSNGDYSKIECSAYNHPTAWANTPFGLLLRAGLGGYPNSFGYEVYLLADNTAGTFTGIRIRKGNANIGDFPFNNPYPQQFPFVFSAKAVEVSPTQLDIEVYFDGDYWATWTDTSDIIGPAYSGFIVDAGAGTGNEVWADYWTDEEPTGGGITGTGNFESQSADWLAQGEAHPTVQGVGDFQAQDAAFAAEGNVAQPAEGAAGFQAQDAQWDAAGDVAVPPAEGAAGFAAEPSDWSARGYVGSFTEGEAGFAAEVAEWLANGRVSAPPTLGEAGFAAERADWSATGQRTQPGIVGLADFVAQPAVWRATDILQTGNQINDCIHAVVGDQLNDGLLAYYHRYGATSPNLMVAEIEFLLLRGASPAALNDMWDEFLTSQGYSSSLQDKLFAYWCENGGVPR